MKKLLLISLLSGHALLTSAPSQAASAIAWADDMTFGYEYGHRSTRDAARGALNRCQKRTTRRCHVRVTCRGGGYGAVTFQRQRGYHRSAIGVSCGAPDKWTAFRQAVQQCNQAAGGNRCGSPRTAWVDPVGFRPR